MLEDLGRGRGRIGAMVPSTNRNLEPDFFLISPEDVSVHFVRIRGEHPSVLPDAQAMERFSRFPSRSPAKT